MAGVDRGRGGGPGAASAAIADVVGWQQVRSWNINHVLDAARAKLRRLTPQEAAGRAHEGWTLVDTRSIDALTRDGRIPGAVHAPLGVLEWRVDPASGYQDPAIAGMVERLILVCAEGYSSSLAAVRLQELGFTETTDVIGGFEAWTAAGLPVELPSA